MDNRDVLEFRKFLRSHKEYIQSNMTYLLFFTSKVHENDHHCISQHANIMNLLLHQKKMMDILDVECNMLQNLALYI
jgi:Golgi nucleoside diphosphatase